MSMGDGTRFRVLLVVEDDLNIQLLIQLTLSADPRLEFCEKATTATTATEAIAIARETDPDLVILDHFIDGQIMGLQAAPLIKAVAPNARIILLSAHNLAVEASREPAIDAYLHKNDLRKLRSTVQRLLRPTCNHHPSADCHQPLGRVQLELEQVTEEGRALLLHGSPAGAVFR